MCTTWPTRFSSLPALRLAVSALSHAAGSTPSLPATMRFVCTLSHTEPLFGLSALEICRRESQACPPALLYGTLGSRILGLSAVGLLRRPGARPVALVSTAL